MAEPRIVAELGRPETAQETADRKAAASRKHRANQTLFNLVIATIASLGIVLFLVLVVVRPTPEPSPSVDYVSAAAEAQGASSEPLVVPVLPADWPANAARFENRSGVLTWYIGFITPSVEFIAFNQGVDANPTWLQDMVDSRAITGTTTIDGVTWDVYDHRTAPNPGNYAYALSTERGGSTFVLHGTASDAEFEALASTIAAEVAQ